MLPSFPFDSPLALLLKQGLLGTRDIMIKAGDYEQQDSKQWAEEADKLSSRHATQQQNNTANRTGRYNRTTKILNMM